MSSQVVDLDIYNLWIVSGTKRLEFLFSYISKSNIERNFTRV